MKRSIAMFVVLCAICTGAQIHKIHAQDSRFVIHVDKAGFFSAFGHKHQVEAPIASGTLDPTAKSIEFTVHAADLKVIDPDTGPKERAEVQDNMEKKVLEVSRFPEITFHSTKIEATRPGEWKVGGELTLHGVTRSINLVAVEPADEVLATEPPKVRHYRGSTSIKQSDFGITPITVGGGAVRVKDELKIDFTLSTE